MVYPVGEPVDTVARYVAAYWERYPEWDPLVRDVGAHDLVYRCELYQRVNAATEGHLAQLVPNHGELWLLSIGLAASIMIEKQIKAGPSPG